jgi:thymidylate synthase (FAD)
LGQGLKIKYKMAKVESLRVELLSYTQDPEQNVVAGIRQCYSKVGAEELKEKTTQETRERLISQVIGSGHTSTVEHASFTFGIEGISRACSHQLVRHRIASFSQQSQRYVDLSKEELGYILPPTIAADEKQKEKYTQVMEELEKKYKELIESGVKPEDARYILPNACQTKMVVTMNARSLLNFFQERTCQRAQWEIRALANQMLEKVKPVAPKIFENAGPTCRSQGICWEGDMSCGRWKSIPGAMLKSRIKNETR